MWISLLETYMEVFSDTWRFGAGSEPNYIVLRARSTRWAFGWWLTLSLLSWAFLWRHDGVKITVAVPPEVLKDNRGWSSSL